jgi:hypothetical protein
MPHREPNYTSCCELIMESDPVASAKFANLRNACGLDYHRAARMFSVELGQYLQIERGEICFRDWRRCMEIMCILSNQPFDLIDRV